MDPEIDSRLPGRDAPPPVLLLPGWQDSGPAHWQTVWEQRHRDRRVVQDDWQWPRRGDWMARLEDTLLDAAAPGQPPALLVAHSLGCHLVAAWAAHSRHTAWVAGALLVAPPDLTRPGLPPQLHGWTAVVRERLPFPATVVLSRDDAFGDFDAGASLARDWGAAVVDAGARGHLNAASGLGDWPEGRALLQALRDAAGHGTR
jgi:predicted alpha/beta hydrolase family esterase